MSLVGALIARGYRPPAPPPARPSYLWLGERAAAADDGASDDLATLVAALRRRLEADSDAPDPYTPLVVLPTYLERTSADDHAAIARQIGEQTRALGDTDTRLLLIGMQHPASSAHAAELRLRQMLAAAHEADPKLVVLGLRLEGSGKLRTVNAAIEVAEALEARFLVLLDDDIRMEPGCLDALVTRHRRDGHGAAIGAVKQAQASNHWTGRLLRTIGASLEPARAYPHACCMTVDLAVVAGGIPWRYVDDGYIFFELVEPGHADPLHRLLMEPAARCHHVVGGSSSGSALAHQRRMLILHHVFLAGYPHKARYYRRHMLFYGLRPIGARAADPTRRAAAARWLLKLLYFALFIVVGTELALRGLVGRPLAGPGWATRTIDRPTEPEPARGAPLAVRTKETPP
ncbi:MAG: glycosyltransferase [Acidobacteriota bacterium]